MAEKFKVVTKPGGVTADKGKGEKSAGISKQDADESCARLNGRAEELGIKTRYEVVPA